MKYFVLLLFLFSVSSFSFENNNFTSNDKQRLFIKAFDDIVFHNRTRISRISQLAEKLGWKEIKTKDATKAYSYWGIKEYLYKDYTIRIKSDYEEEIFAIFDYLVTKRREPLTPKQVADRKYFYQKRECEV